MTNRIWNNESGVLTFEWILLITLLVIGIVGGLAVVRDAYIAEASETAGAMMGINQGYVVQDPVKTKVSSAGKAGIYGADGTYKSTYVFSSNGYNVNAQGSLYTDKVGEVYVDAPGKAYSGR